jgi:hypothetical protein
MDYGTMYYFLKGNELQKKICITASLRKKITVKKESEKLQKLQKA